MASVRESKLRGGGKRRLPRTQRNPKKPKAAKHGESPRHSRTKEYSTWLAMRERCYDAKSEKYQRYGARGIKMSEDWADDYTVFLRDMGRAPTKAHSIDRIDNNGPYSKENCRWATKTEQSENRSITVWVTFGGKTLSMSAWAREIGVHVGTLFSRRKRGLSVELILSSDDLRRRTPE